MKLKVSKIEMEYDKGVKSLSLTDESFFEELGGQFLKYKFLLNQRLNIENQWGVRS
jgi:hypothetical protein